MINGSFLQAFFKTCNGSVAHRSSIRLPQHLLLEKAASAITAVCSRVSDIAPSPSIFNMASGDALTSLQSNKSADRLKQISRLRARGVADSIDLPQLVVCGDQSAGKSSVLEALSGIPFPRDEGVCTRFPTEIIITHDESVQPTISATIIPHTRRSDASKALLRGFHRTIKTINELPEVIRSAGNLMGLSGYGNISQGPAFSMDVLQIKVINRSGLHLSIVDLPGLIAVASDVQTEADVATVQDMVTAYIEKPRTIILAVVQAGNDIANQSIIRKSKAFDRDGRRTVGIITKPDLINRGAEARIALLSKGLDTTKLKLGFYLLKNPTPNELKDGITAIQRETNEMKFFTSSPWKEQDLDYNRVGIAKLKDNLQTLLDEHISRELPKVREDIKARLKSVQEALAVLPLDRPSSVHKRMFLSDLAIKYQRLTTSALDGDYSAAGSGDFFSLDNEKHGKTRLRAEVHSANTSFATYMRVHGRKTVVCANPKKRKTTDTQTNTNKRNATAPQPKSNFGVSTNNNNNVGPIFGATNRTAQIVTTNNVTGAAGGFGVAGGFRPALAAATNGTSGPPFWLERDTSANQDIAYQSITTLPGCVTKSFEELRLEHYKQRRGFGNDNDSACKAPVLSGEHPVPATMSPSHAKCAIGASLDEQDLVLESTPSSCLLATDGFEDGDINVSTDQYEYGDLGQSQGSIDDHDSAVDLDEAVRVFTPAQMKAWVFEVGCFGLECVSDSANAV
jgi:GTPase SAR1 family protein